MAVIKLKIAVGNIDDVLASFNVIKVFRSTTGAVGPYTEITAPATRIPLVDDQIVYDYTDESGDESYYYKSSFFNSNTALESQLSDAQQGEGDPALEVLSVSELKTNYLFGLDLTNDQGVEYPDSLYEFYIRAAVSWIELKLDIPLRTKRIVEEEHDYFREDYDKFISLETDVFPILEVEEIKLVLPGEQVVQVFDPSWLHVLKEAGQINLVPGTGTAGSILLGASGAWIPLIYGNNRWIPRAFRVTYTAGFNPIPEVLRDVVGKTASFGPLNIAGDLLGGAGIASQSVSIDGLSQNFNTTSSATSAGYGARLLQYSRELKEVLPTLRRQFKGVALRIV